LGSLGDVFGKTKEIDIVFTRQNNVLRVFITCLDTAIIPDTWVFKIKHEFFRLRFEVEGMPRHTATDVTMSEAPGGGGDDDPKTQGQDKGAEPDRHAKRTKNAEENEGHKGDKSGPTSPPNDNVNTLGLVKHTLRYDTVFSYSNEHCLNPKKLFHYFSEVLDKCGECMPNPAPQVASPMRAAKNYARKYREEGGRVPAMSLVHGDRTPRHAGSV
jgi:hypothetical protein